MENIVRCVVCAGAGIFSLLHLVAAGSAVRKEPKPSHIVMSLGALGLLGAIMACFLGGRMDWLLALFSCGLICGAAVYNGKTAGNLHPSHHIARAAYACILVFGFLQV